MTIHSDRINKSTLVMSLTGRLDTATAPQLERKIKQWGDEITELVLDFSGLSYISSMGLRVLLQTQKALNAKGRKLIIKNMIESVREVFEMTGFIKLLVEEEKFVVIRKEENDRIVLSLIGTMDGENIPLLSKELSQIKEANQEKEGDTAVALDMVKLTALSPAGCRQLKKAIEETGWERRKLVIINGAKEINDVLTAEEMGIWLDISTAV